MVPVWQNRLTRFRAVWQNRLTRLRAVWQTRLTRFLYSSPWSPLAVAVAAAATLQTAGSSAQQPTFRAETDLVSLGITVTDRRGELLANLTADDFEILED